MIELKWVRADCTTTLPLRLLYRAMQPCVDAAGALCPGEWSEWKPVPTELVSEEDFVAARSPYLRPNAPAVRPAIAGTHEPVVGGSR